MAKFLHTRIKTNNIRNSSNTIRSNEGSRLETSAFLIVHGGNSTFINTFDKTKIFLNISLSHRRSATVSLETRNLFFEHHSYVTLNMFMPNFMAFLVASGTALSKSCCFSEVDTSPNLLFQPFCRTKLKLCANNFFGHTDTCHTAYHIR